MKNKTYIWNRIAQKTLEIAYIAALCVFMVLFSMLLIVICIVIHCRIVPLESWRRMDVYEKKMEEETSC